MAKATTTEVLMGPFEERKKALIEYAVESYSDGYDHAIEDIASILEDFGVSSIIVGGIRDALESIKEGKEWVS